MNYKYLGISTLLLLLLSIVVALFISWTTLVNLLPDPKVYPYAKFRLAASHYATLSAIQGRIQGTGTVPRIASITR